MNKKSQLQFIHKCAVLLESGISLSETISIVITIENSKKTAAVLKKIRGDVERGTTFSKSILINIPRFEPTLLSMISFGESSGILALSIRQGLEMMEKGSQIKKKLIGALIYPAFIALATIAMTLFLVMYIFPKIIPLFSSMNITLPLLTRLVRALYLSLIAYGLYATIAVVLLGGIFIILYKKKREFRRKIQMFLLTFPLIGTILQKYFISGFCRSIGTLLECGQPLPIILQQVSEAASFEVYKKSWQFTREEITRGASISTALSSFKSIFPPIVPNMLSIGERTGSLVSMFRHISTMFEEELDQFIKQLSTSIEPILMITMGLIVGGVALSIILPIYEITNHLTK